MKTLSVISLAAAAWLAMPVLAQIDGPPALIDYQGRVLDSLGDPVAPGSTENVEMYFRIWNHISDNQGPNLLWAEKQIVTVADGNFSVRLGEGELIESSAGDNVVVPGNDDPRPSLLTVFDEDERFLGVSVAANSVSKPTAEIQPRLAFLTTPFAAVAEKARVAEFGPSSGIFEADQIGIGTSSPGSLLEVTGPNQLTNTNGSGLISSGAWGGNHIAFDADDIQAYSNGSTPGIIKLNEHGGDIKIGSIGAATRIEGTFNVFGGANGGQFKVQDNAPVGGEQIIAVLDASFGTGGAQLEFSGDGGSMKIGTDSTGRFVVEQGSSKRLTIARDGKVGISNSAPSEALTVSGGNVYLTGGDIKLLQHSGGTFQTNYDPRLEWVSPTGTTYAQIMRWRSFNRLHVANNGTSLTGVYLGNGSTSWLSFSDERLKSDVQPLTGILDKIENIRVAEFNMASVNVDPDSGKAKLDFNRPSRTTKDGKVIKHEIGSIAQDWLEHFPELVTEPENDDDHYGLAYDRIGVVAIGAAQELNQKLKECEDTIRERDSKIADLEARLARLEALISAAQ